jgi:hypothetical protein
MSEIQATLSGFPHLTYFRQKHLFMATSIAAKMKIKPGMKLLALHAPADFQQTLAPLPDDVVISTKNTAPDQIHWFVLNKKAMEKEMKQVLAWLAPGRTLWIYYPKATSKIQTNLSRDKGWEKLLDPKNKISWITLVSLNDTWSAFACRLQDKNPVAKKTAEREILKWVDPVKKTVRLPHDLKDALRKNKEVNAYFESLAYSHRKEYVEWIVTAKKDETRKARIEGTLERLQKKWKNPANNQ